MRYLNQICDTHRGFPFSPFLPSDQTWRHEWAWLLVRRLSRNQMFTCESNFQRQFGRNKCAFAHVFIPRPASVLNAWMPRAFTSVTPASDINSRVQMSVLPRSCSWIYPDDGIQKFCHSAICLLNDFGATFKNAYQIGELHCIPIKGYQNQQSCPF